MKKIIILGSEGFIGSHLVAHFRDKGWQVHGCDLHPFPTQNYIYSHVSGITYLENIFSATLFDACINAAGSGSIPYSIAQPVADFEANSLDTLRVLEAIRLYNAGCKYLHISSAAVYGNPSKLPVNESGPLHPLSPYGWHKLIAEELCREYKSLYGLQIAIARPFSVYGPGLRKQLFWDLYQKSLSDNNQIELWGTGNESRDFIFIDDLVKSFELLIEKSDPETLIYNIASGAETSVKEVTEKLFMQLCPNKNIVFNRQVRAGDPLNWRADISRLNALGFAPSYTIDQGISKVAKWLQSLS